jgi:pyruvate/2-oxoglutarate/acetoin dehydrogenase E1 component
MSLLPFDPYIDIETVKQSLAKTHHLVTMEQGWPVAGISAEIAAQVCESEYYHFPLFAKCLNNHLSEQATHSSNWMPPLLE